MVTPVSRSGVFLEIPILPPPPQSYSSALYSFCSSPSLSPPPLAARAPFRLKTLASPAAAADRLKVGEGGEVMASSACEAGDGMSSVQCEPVESLVEWRSSEQVEKGTPSTSPPYWDTDSEDESGGKPSDLYGKFTWKIENYSQNNKRELKSDAFEVGNCKWYILIYPQGCDVPHHLSLFLCVANHDQLLPGWSHFAQFTIAVVNKDPKKSKYSDTLHRFWKKEHDWGWKKFMELTKVSDGFIVSDTLVIKAQVQMIREKAHRPFRCLDCQYRRELVQIYLSNVEQICRRFIEERRGKLSKLIDDKVKWSSFRSFWLGIDQNARWCMYRERTDTILRVIVKHFFIEKEVTSTLVMDSLYSGLKALEFQSKNSKGRIELLEMEEPLPPLVLVENDIFILADDVLLLLERAAFEPLPHQTSPPKDEKGSQNRCKDESAGDDSNKESIERDERRLTELGRRTVEIFVLTHIFCSRIEVAYQEAVALKRQEELIREEEEAEHELKAKRGVSDKEKLAKKKQAKQRRSNRKGKDRQDEKSEVTAEGKHQEISTSCERILGELSSEQAEPVLGKIEITEDVSDVCDNGNDVDGDDENLQLDVEDKVTAHIGWDTDASEIHPATEASSSVVQAGQMEKRGSFITDDSSSTCSTDSIPSAILNRSCKGNLLPSNKSQASSNKGKQRRKKRIHDQTHGGNNLSSSATSDAGQLYYESCGAPRPQSEDVLPSKSQMELHEQHTVEKEAEVVPQQKLDFKDEVHVSSPFKSRREQCSFSNIPLEESSSATHSSEAAMNAATTSITSELASCIKFRRNQPEMQTLRAVRSHQSPLTFKSEDPKLVAQPKSTTATDQASDKSKPLSTPHISGPDPVTPVASSGQVAPILSRSVSAAGRLHTDSSPSFQRLAPQSYRNAILGKTTMDECISTLNHSSFNSSSQTAAYPQSTSAFILSPSLQSTLKNDQDSVKPSFSFGSVALDTLQNPGKQIVGGLRDIGLERSTHHANGKIDNNGGLPFKSRPFEDYSGVSVHQAQGMVSDEFPHLDIINDLLDDENDGRMHSHRRYHHLLDRQYTFPRGVTSASISPLDISQRFDHDERSVGGELAYGSSGMFYNGLVDTYPLKVDFPAYANSQIEDMLQQQLPSSANFSMLRLDNADANGYPYQVPDFTNLAPAGRYDMYRSANRL